MKKKEVIVKNIDTGHLAPGDHGIVILMDGKKMRTSTIEHCIVHSVGGRGCITLETQHTIYRTNPMIDETDVLPGKPKKDIVGCDLRISIGEPARVMLADGKVLVTSAVQRYSVAGGVVYIETKNSIYTTKKVMNEW